LAAQIWPKMTLRMTLSQGSLENVHGLTLLGGAEVAVDLHRRLARCVTQQLLGDPRMDARPDEEARRSMAEVVEPHPGQPGALQEPLEVVNFGIPSSVAGSATSARGLGGTERTQGARLSTTRGIGVGGGARSHSRKCPANSGHGWVRPRGALRFLCRRPAV
jgi:hypothetical protein